MWHAPPPPACVGGRGVHHMYGRPICRVVGKPLCAPQAAYEPQDRPSTQIKSNQIKSSPPYLPPYPYPPLHHSPSPRPPARTPRSPTPSLNGTTIHGAASSPLRVAGAPIQVPPLLPEPANIMQLGKPLLHWLPIAVDDTGRHGASYVNCMLGGTASPDRWFGWWLIGGNQQGEMEG